MLIVTPFLSVTLMVIQGGELIAGRALSMQPIFGLVRAEVATFLCEV
jgi:hypothetical protein